MMKFEFLMPDDGLHIGGGAEEAEVADQSTEEVEGAEEQEVAEPASDNSKTPADAAFAELRRKNEALEKQLKEYDEALGYFFDGEDKPAQAQAFKEERSVEDVKAEREKQAELESLREENEALREQITTREVEQMMAKDLREIQAIDPSVKSLTELGEMFFDLISTGQVSGVDAYYAVKAKARAESINTPEPVGEVNATSDEKDFYTKAEVDGMSPAEIHKNYDAIRRSMTKW